MKSKAGAVSPEAYIAEIDEKNREDVRALDQLIRETLPHHPPSPCRREAR